MNLPVLGATGLIGPAPAATDQPPVPGFADLVTALLAGSDVISDEVALSGYRQSTGAQDQEPSGTETNQDPGDPAGLDGGWSALMGHPSLVADALLRHLGQVETAGPLNETPVGESPPLGPEALGTPVAPVAAPTAVVSGPTVQDRTAPAPPVPAPADPIAPEVSPIGSTDSIAPPPPPSTEPAEERRPATSELPDAPVGPTPATPEAAAMAAAAGGPPVAAPVVSNRPATKHRIDSGGPEPRRLTGSPAERAPGREIHLEAADRPADDTIENEAVPEQHSAVRSETLGEAPAIPTDRAQRDVDLARIGTRSVEALSTAARRVEEAVRQLEAAPPPRSVTMVIEELDLRLTVAIRPDGVHLTAPGPEAQTLIRSLEEALRSRGFDLSGRQRGRQGHEQPEAPVIHFAPRPTTRPASGLRL
jgi:hypothetical protein